MGKWIGLGTLILVVTAPAAWAAETAFEFIGCGISKSIPLESSPGMTASGIENWAINTSTATKGWENATEHCVGSVRIMDGKPQGIGMCKWQDSTGDSAIFEWEVKPSGERTVVWVSGTGKYKGIKGGGNFTVNNATKPVVEGTTFQCIRDFGKYTLP